MKILLKKVTVEILYISMLSVLCLTTMNTTKAQTYDPYDVQVINNLIKNNGLDAKSDAPETWWFVTWSNETPKKIKRLEVSYRELEEEASFAGLTKMTALNCSDNYLTKINLTNCSSLVDIICISNKLTEINLTGVGPMIYEIAGEDQKVRLTLYKNKEGKYSLPISLNEPTFYEEKYDEPPFTTICTAVTYKNGILESSDNKLEACDFRIKPIGYEYSNGGYLEGYIAFTYSDESGINVPNMEGLKIYPNPIYDTLFIEYSFTISSLLTVKFYDMLGKEVLNQSINSNDGISISHLENGSYVVNVFLEGKVIGNTKIVKQ